MSRRHQPRPSATRSTARGCMGIVIWCVGLFVAFIGALLAYGFVRALVETRP